MESGKSPRETSIPSRPIELQGDSLIWGRENDRLSHSPRPRVLTFAAELPNSRSAWAHPFLVQRADASDLPRNSKERPLVSCGSFQLEFPVEDSGIWGNHRTPSQDIPDARALRLPILKTSRVPKPDPPSTPSWISLVASNYVTILRYGSNLQPKSALPRACIWFRTVDDSVCQ